MNFVRYAHWLKEAGFTVYIFCVKDSKIEQKAKDLGIEQVIVNRNKKNFDFKNVKIVKRHLLELEIDTVWVRDRRDINIFSQIKRKREAKHINLVYQQAMQFAKKKKDFFHTRNYKQINLWIAPLQFLKDEVVEKTNFPEERIAVIPLASDLNWNKPPISKETALEKLNLPKDKLIIGVIGRLDPLKGQLFLVNALAKLKEEFSHLDLLIVGEKTYNEHDDYVEKLYTTIKKEGLENRVHIRPFMKDIRYFFESVDRFIMASKAETIGMVTIESMSYGTPVIGTNAGGTPELLGFGAYGDLYEPENLQDFIKVLRNNLNANDNVLIKAKKGKQIALKKYSKENVVQEIVNTI